MSSLGGADNQGAQLSPWSRSGMRPKISQSHSFSWELDSWISSTAIRRWPLSSCHQEPRATLDPVLSKAWPWHECRTPYPSTWFLRHLQSIVAYKEPKNSGQFKDIWPHPFLQRPWASHFIAGQGALHLLRTTLILESPLDCTELCFPVPSPSCPPGHLLPFPGSSSCSPHHHRIPQSSIPGTGPFPVNTLHKFVLAGGSQLNLSVQSSPLLAKYHHLDLRLKMLQTKSLFFCLISCCLFFYKTIY